MTKSCFIKISYSKDQREKYMEAQRLKSQASSIESQLCKEAKEHEEIRVAQKLTGWESVNRIEVGQSGFSVKFMPRMKLEKGDEQEPKPKPKPPVPSLQYMDPKVLNNLLNSSLLSDKQKRLMLKATIPNFAAAVFPDEESAPLETTI